MYLDYEEYERVFGGKLPEEDFTRLELRASAILNYYTFNRIEEVDNNIKGLISELVNFEQKLEEELIDNEDIKSETVDTHSITYKDKKMTSQAEARKSKLDIIKVYLGHTNLLYRGV